MLMRGDWLYLIQKSYVPCLLHPVYVTGLDARLYGVAKGLIDKIAQRSSKINEITDCIEGK